MADSITTAGVTGAPVPEALPSGPGAPARLARAGRAAARWAGIVPFTVYVAAGLIAPLIAIAVNAFEPSSGGFVVSRASGPTLSNIDTAVHGTYLTGLRDVVLLSLVTAVLPAVFGFALAYAIHTSRRGTVLRRVVITLSGVFANFGGVPLAFLFIAALSTTGVVTGWIKDVSGVSIWDHGFSLFNPKGIALAYLYFQIPLMVLVILPALEGLRPAWREAAENLGARSWHYWRYVAGPVLAPSFLGCLLLLFGGGLSAYATAEALTGGTVALTPIQIGALLNGNVVAGQENLGYALGLILVAIIAVVMIGYTLLQRRAARWLR